MKRKPNLTGAAAALRRRAEIQLRARQRQRSVGIGGRDAAADTQRLLQELQVHQVELEMQNAELQEARDRMETLLEKYTDLYDFAPVGYFSLDEQGLILEVNLTGAALLGVARSRLFHRSLPRCVAPASQARVRAFLEQVFAASGKRVCEAELLHADGGSFWAHLHAVSANARSAPRRWCRVAVSDITALKRAEEAQRRLEALALANRELQREVARRQAVEESLRRSEQEQSRLLAQSRLMQDQLRHLSRQLLSAQEEERKRISRELHDVVAQALTGIIVQLATLKTDAKANAEDLIESISQTQRMVEKSVAIVHRFALELRPAALDDLGLIPALTSFLKSFTKETGIRASLTACAAVEKLEGTRRTVLYRVAQEALTNAARHAQASQVEVTLQRVPRAVRLQIKDNGKSFRMDRVFQARKSKHLGLLGMRERVELVGGCLTVESSPGKGTLIQVQIPFGQGRRRAGGKPVREIAVPSAS